MITLDRRSPQRISTEDATITSPTLMKPNVTTPSSQGCALWPAAEIGDSAAVPRIAASAVTAQFAYVAYRTPQYAATFTRGGSLTSAQAAPSAMRKIPFITPSRCAPSPMRGFVNCGSTNPVSKPSTNRNIPCKINWRLESSMDAISANQSGNPNTNIVPAPVPTTYCLPPTA